MSRNLFDLSIGTFTLSIASAHVFLLDGKEANFGVLQTRCSVETHLSHSKLQNIIFGVPHDTKLPKAKESNKAHPLMGMNTSQWCVLSEIINVHHVCACVAANLYGWQHEQHAMIQRPQTRRKWQLGPKNGCSDTTEHVQMQPYVSSTAWFVKWLITHSSCSYAHSFHNET